MSEYNSYKESGVSWIGEIPAEWEISRNKNCFSCEKNIVGNESANCQLLSLTINGVRQKSKDGIGGKIPESYDTYQYVEKDNLIMCLFDLDCSAVFSGLSKYSGMISPAYKVLKCKTNIIPEYADYWFRSVFIGRKFKFLSKNIRYSLTYEDFSALALPLPPINEQGGIADFLNKTCMKIDSIISEAKDSIEEYKTWKASIIYEAVTKGLDPNVEMKDSGIEWIGKIPSTWKIVRGKNILVLLDRPVKSTDDVITCFRDGEVTLRKNRREDGFTISLQETGYQGIEPGDLVVHGMDGFAGAIGVSDSRGKATPVLNVMDSSQNKRFLMYYLRAAAYKDVFMSLSTGIRVRSCDLRWNKIAIFPFIIPPIEKQNEIVNYIDSVLPKITAMVEEKEKLISDLESYKKSLIFEVVTGKRRVC